MQRAFLGILLVVVLSWVGNTRAAGPDATDFARGNAFYADGKFTEAVGAYEAQARRGEYSANLFYNLANACFRKGDRGRAILNYQRALLLEPSHAEAAANLAFVRGRGRAPMMAGGGFVNWFEIDNWTWLAVAGGWLAFLGLGAAFLGSRARWAVSAAGFCGVIGCGVSLWAIKGLDGGAKNPARAVVLADDTRALYSPADNSKAVFTLPAGDEVLVLSEQGAWDYVQLGDGSRGWVAAQRVEKVVPSGTRG